MTRTLDDRIDAIRAGVERLRTLDSAFALFGASGHRYALAPVLREEQVAAFEQAEGFRLPDDYRAFMTRVGDGGAGPFYGILPLGGIPATSKGLTGRPASPFPHTEAWNWSQERLADLADDETGALLDEYAAPLDGAIPIVDEGCGSREWLVVSGPEAGNVWHDATADEGGYLPWASGRRPRFDLTCVTWRPAMMWPRGFAARPDVDDEPQKERVSFLDWYELWLGRALRALSR